MRQYVIDELRYSDYEKIKKYLNEHYEKGPLGGIFYLPLEFDLCTELQKEHISCQPFCFCLNLTENKISCELLVRSRKTIRCECGAVATEKQRNILINKIDTLLSDLEIIC